MSLVVEDGSGKPNAQTFADLDYLKQFARARGVSLPSATNECEAMLTAGWDAMLGLDYLGRKATKMQRGDWPRIGVCIDKFNYASTEIPHWVLDGQCALAIESEKTDLMPTIAANASGGVVEKTVGPITLRYADSGRASSRPIIERAKAHLNKVLRSTGSTLRIERG